MKILQSNARKLASEASKTGAMSVGGKLIKEDGRYWINQIDITDFLEELLEQNVLLVVGVIDLETEERAKTCLTCGREYTGAECPRCARVRSRLRGSQRSSWDEE